jgi:predicted enzyme related to lactoylglutathione lyase
MNPARVEAERSIKNAAGNKAFQAVRSAVKRELQSMKEDLSIKSANTILYCEKWEPTVAFYKDCLKLPTSLATDWFVEFRLTDTACLSVADEKRATVKSNRGAAITLSFQAEDIKKTRQLLLRSGLTPGPIKDHAWGAQVFYLFDPEGHRIEFWSQTQPPSA